MKVDTLCKAIGRGRSAAAQPETEGGPVDYSTYVLSRTERNTSLALAAGTLFLLGLVFFNSISAGLVLLPGALFYPGRRALSLRDRRKKELNIQFKDALYFLSGALGVGHSLENSFKAALHDLRLLYAPDSYILKEISRICRQVEVNVPVEQALHDLAYRSGLEDIRNFADVIAICKRTGGNLVQVVRSTSGLIREKIDIMQNIEILLTKQKYEQRVLNAMPFVFIAVLRVSGSGYMDSLYQSPAGYVLMGLALSILALSYFVSGKIVDIKV